MFEERKAVTALESSTQVVLGGTRGGPDVSTLRQDRWWLQPVITVSILTSFVIYATWAAFQGVHYFVGGTGVNELISPFYSPCLSTSCVEGSNPFGFALNVGSLSPALIILIFPLGFRMTCYYYRRSYYRAFWWSPPACAVADAHTNYSGETRFPLVIQNAHRYFFYFGVIFNVLLTYDAIRSFHVVGGGWGISVGSLVLTLNATLLWLYSLSCHACRHICGGQLRSFSQHPIRHKLWKLATPLNAKHMNFAWASLFVVALTDVYVRLVSSGAIRDLVFF